MRIRVATIEDAAALVEIYRYYIEKTAITFEYDVPSIEEFERRIQTTLEKFPYYVVEEEGEVLGYAYSGPFASRKAFSWSAEISIYLKQGQQKKGYGKKLYQLMEAKLKELGYQNVYACIATPEVEDEYLTNNSVQYHEYMGYRLVGEFKRCGYKFDRWYHIVWMEKWIGKHESPIEEPKSFSEHKKVCENSI